MNAGKSKVMVVTSGGKMIVNSGKWSCSVCGKGVQANSVLCTVIYIKLIHKRCSGVCGDLSRVADGFMCRRCDETIKETDLAQDYIEEQLDLYKTDLSKSWKVIKEIIGKTKTMHNSTKFNINGNPTDDEAVISNSRRTTACSINSKSY